MSGIPCQVYRFGAVGVSTQLYYEPQELLFMNEVQAPYSKLGHSLARAIRKPLDNSNFPGSILKSPKR